MHCIKVWNLATQLLPTLDDKNEKKRLFFHKSARFFKSFIQAVCFGGFPPEYQTLVQGLAFTASLLFKGYVLETMLKSSLLTRMANIASSYSPKTGGVTTGVVMDFLENKQLREEFDHITLSCLLPSTHAMIEFVHTGESSSSTSNNNNYYYAAFCVKGGGCKDLLFFTVNAEEVNIQIEQTVVLWAGKVYSPSTTAVGTIPNPEKLSELLLKPLWMVFCCISHLAAFPGQLTQQHFSLTTSLSLILTVQGIYFFYSFILLWNALYTHQSYLVLL
eukprot:TRINITY_DN28221_c0_g1_i1.p1 TRINITY_DN28221_c0_g1~~TRINITY_DN28221_c0_g1_i1.p1  ORF type:complete len:275 (+),score=38.73 TRINITY_DN28221_c0_g1_i1:410-1234(+)